MVEFDCLDSAIQAKKNLHGCDIYSGCCTLKVEFAKTDRLQVKRNDDMSWDYTDEFSRAGHGLPKERPVLLTEPPKMSMGTGGGGGPAGGIGGMGSAGLGMGMGGSGGMS